MIIRFFKEPHSPKAFVRVAIGIILLLHVFAYAVWNIPYERDDFLFDYQMGKLKTDLHINTIIVGDSAAGYALDAEEFAALSEGNVLNLALTRLNGFASSLMMIKQARLGHPEIQNVVIVQSLDVWNLPFSREWFFRMESGISTDEIDSSFFVSYKWLDRLAYQTNFKWLYRYVKYAIKGPPQASIVNDYMNVDMTRTYRNGGLVMEAKGLPVTDLDSSVQNGYLLLDEYCRLENINCIYVSAPIHETTHANTDASLYATIFDFMHQASSIRVVDTIFALPNEYMLDSITHLHPASRKEVTRLYYDAVGEYLY